jgi:hypothetical protein
MPPAEGYPHPNRVGNESPSFALWLLRKILPYLVVGAIAGVTIGFLKSEHPDALRILQITGAAVFGLMFLLYSWWAIHRSNSGYHWSVPERLGILASAVAALILSVRLALPTLPGAIWAYLLVSFILAFIIRPVLNDYGWKKYHGEHHAAAGANKPRR